LGALCYYILHILADAVEEDYPGIPHIQKMHILKIHCMELCSLGQTAREELGRSRSSTLSHNLSHSRLSPAA